MAGEPGGNFRVILSFITHDDVSRMSKLSSVSLIRLCDSVSVCVCVCPHDIKPKRLKLKSPNSVQGNLAHHLIFGQRSQDQKVQKVAT